MVLLTLWGTATMLKSFNVGLLKIRQFENTHMASVRKAKSKDEKSLLFASDEHDGVETMASLLHKGVSPNVHVW